MVAMMVVQGMLFLFVARALWGQLPYFLPIVLVGVCLLNLRFARACGSCGEPLWRKRQDPFPPVCTKCGGSFVSLWTAALRSGWK